jgi:hypothetical protein
MAVREFLQIAVGNWPKLAAEKVSTGITICRKIDERWASLFCSEP